MESYFAQRGREAPAVSATESTGTPYQIEVRFLGGLNETHKAAFREAANRWTRVIAGDLPSFEVDGEAIDDLLITAEGIEIDGSSGTLGRAGPTHLRPNSQLPIKGLMEFDTADLDAMESEGTLHDVITHEMGHVIGIGTIWSAKGVLEGAGGPDPTFTGGGARGEYGALMGKPPENVPVANTGGPGTRDGHWREARFAHELMSGFISTPGNPMSRMTAASLGDLGYEVDLGGAEAYELSTEELAAETGRVPVKHSVATEPRTVPPEDQR